jgi:hypothetical protein
VASELRCPRDRVLIARSPGVLEPAREPGMTAVSRLGSVDPDPEPGDGAAGRTPRRTRNVKEVFGRDDVEPLLGVTALESVGITVDPVNRAPKRLPAIPLK